MIADSGALVGMKQVLARQPGLVVAYVFGSVARGKERQGSDIDIAVQFEAPLEWRCQVQLQAELDGLSGRPVDLVQLQQAPIELQCAIIADRTRIYERSVEERIDIEARIMSLYADALPRLQWQWELALRGPAIERREERIGEATDLYRRTVGELDRTLAAAAGRVSSE